MPFQDNHMDDLFKRAAENFPLKVQESDWNAIGSRLNKSDVITVKTNPRSQFIFIAVMAALLLHLPYKLFETPYQDEKFAASIVATTKGISDVNQQDRKNIDEQILSMPNKVMPQINYENTFSEARILIEEAQYKTANNTLENNKIFESIITTDSLEKDITDIQPTQVNNEKIGLVNSQDTRINIDTATVIEAIVVEENVIHFLPTPAVPKVAAQPVKKPLSGWYAGINTGISFSIVKGQQLSEPGYTAGLGLGYKLSPSWSLETGIKFSEKKYYSNGEYFIPKNADPNMPPDMKVVSVNSKTLLLEIPLKAKYNFNKTLKGQFFLTGGLNTFVVGKEVNDYIIYVNGSNGTMQATYNDNESYLGAAIDVSAGYEKFFKNNQSLRIEPWIQIARKGIGVGQLPVSGFGVQAGYFFHK